MARPWLVRRDQTVAVEGAPTIEVMADPTRILQIVANLVTNASTHSPEGGAILIRIARSSEAVEVTVSDEGIGVPPEDLDRIFEMFTTIRRADVQGGLGIGLGLSRRLAELHDGQLTAESDGEGKGARFTLTLPAGRLETGRHESDAPPSRSGRVSKPRLTIAVVEDNQDSADMMSEWLQHLGHKVSVARTGPDGLALIVETRPDVVLCDIGLPEMDGVEVCQRVMEQMVTPPVMVALSGWGAESDRLRTAAVGFRHHLVKPVDPDSLLGLLESIALKAAGAEGRQPR
jgi:CheY-like chemotaxis protein/anti-sigma regulatory factor (Ser/Thr protein kinase)